MDPTKASSQESPIIHSAMYVFSYAVFISLVLILFALRVAPSFR
jgi:hypothetical protein